VNKKIWLKRALSLACLSVSCCVLDFKQYFDRWWYPQDKTARNWRKCVSYTMLFWSNKKKWNWMFFFVLQQRIVVLKKKSNAIFITANFSIEPVSRKTVSSSFSDMCLGSWALSQASSNFQNILIAQFVSGTSIFVLKSPSSYTKSPSCYLLFCVLPRVYLFFNSCHTKIRFAKSGRF